jgi:hypothetical protein
MSRMNLPGTALTALCLVALLAGTSCQRQPSPPASERRVTSDIQEMEDLVKATKQHPSLQPGSNEAGPPIHVDPYPHSAGMGHNMAGMAHAGPAASGAAKH